MRKKSNKAAAPNPEPDAPGEEEETPVKTEVEELREEVRREIAEVDRLRREVQATKESTRIAKLDDALKTVLRAAGCKDDKLELLTGALVRDGRFEIGRKGELRTTNPEDLDVAYAVGQIRSEFIEFFKRDTSPSNGAQLSGKEKYDDWRGRIGRLR